MYESATSDFTVYLRGVILYTISQEITTNHVTSNEHKRFQIKVISQIIAVHFRKNGG